MTRVYNIIMTAVFMTVSVESYISAHNRMHPRQSTLVQTARPVSNSSGIRSSFSRDSRPSEPIIRQYAAIKQIESVVDDSKSNSVQYLRQLMYILFFYVFHILFLSQNQLVLPFQLLPNNHGHMCTIGYDSIVGMSLFLFFMKKNGRKVGPRPWNLPSEKARFRLSTFFSAMALVLGYFQTGKMSLFWEDLLLNMRMTGFKITQPMLMSLNVLLGHLNWLVLGYIILRVLPRPPKFFQTTNLKSRNEYRWFSSFKGIHDWKWVVGGYMVSGWLFNLADMLNQYILPATVMLNAPESIVSQMVNTGDTISSIVGFIAPCLTAPWWEEILYRGFTLPLLCQMMGFIPASFLQAVVFSWHHMSLAAAIPLFFLGWLWAIIYRFSGNLSIVVGIHMLWNTRVFDKPHNCCIASYIEVELNKRNSNIPKRPRPTITTRTGTARGRGPCANVAPSTLCKEPGEGVVPTGTGKQRRLPLATA